MPLMNPGTKSLVWYPGAKVVDELGDQVFGPMLERLSLESKNKWNKRFNMGPNTWSLSSVTTFAPE